MFLTILGLTSMIFTTGCVTPANPSGQIAAGGVTIDPKAVGQTIEMAAQLSTAAVVRNNPETRQYFEMSSVAIAAVIASGDYNPTNLINAVSCIDSKNQEVSLGIATAVGIYQSLYGQIVNSKITNASPYTIPALNGLIKGINQGLAMVPVPVVPVVVPVTTSTNQ